MNINNLPLLPALVKRAKDVARAVKDGIHVAIKAVAENTLTHLLDLMHFEVTGYGIEPWLTDRRCVTEFWGCKWPEGGRWGR